MIVSKKSKKFPKRKRIPKTKDGVLKRIIDEYGVERFYCIGCQRYKLYEEMRQVSKKAQRTYGMDSYCKECDKKRRRKKPEKQYGGNKLQSGIVVGRKPVRSLRFPPMDAEIPLWYRGMGYSIGYYFKE